MPTAKTDRMTMSAARYNDLVYLVLKKLFCGCPGGTGAGRRSMTLHDVAIRLAADYGGQPAPPEVWDEYKAACAAAHLPAADTHQAAAVHAFTLALAADGHRQLDVSVRHLVQSHMVPR